MRSGVASALAAFLLALAPAGAAAATCPQTSLGDLEDEVMCTVCGTTLGLATEAPQAQRQRAFVVERIDRCQSKEQIKAALAGEFGAEVLAAPDEGGFGLAAYAVPVLVLLGAGAAAGFGALRWRGHRRAAGAEGPPLATNRAHRLDADLERYDL